MAKRPDRVDVLAGAMRALLTEPAYLSELLTAQLRARSYPARIIAVAEELAAAIAVTEERVAARGEMLGATS